MSPISNHSTPETRPAVQQLPLMSQYPNILAHSRAGRETLLCFVLPPLTKSNSSLCPGNAKPQQQSVSDKSWFAGCGARLLALPRARLSSMKHTDRRQKWRGKLLNYSGGPEAIHQHSCCILFPACLLLCCWFFYVCFFFPLLHAWHLPPAGPGEWIPVWLCVDNGNWDVNKRGDVM